MNTKLTLTLEKEIIEKAKIFASANGRSLSEMVETYFKYLTRNEHPTLWSIQSDKLTNLRGILKVESDFDYKKVLNEEKLKKNHA
ncbi:MAG: hypothetical protein JXR07_08570 [Reichenbachiella sp.]